VHSRRVDDEGPDLPLPTPPRMISCRKSEIFNLSCRRHHTRVLLIIRGAPSRRAFAIAAVLDTLRREIFSDEGSVVLDGVGDVFSGSKRDVPAVEFLVTAPTEDVAQRMTRARSRVQICRWLKFSGAGAGWEASCQGRSRICQPWNLGHSVSR
jgi:hypothetical protein